MRILKFLTCDATQPKSQHLYSKTECNFLSTYQEKPANPENPVRMVPMVKMEIREKTVPRERRESRETRENKETRVILDLLVMTLLPKLVIRLGFRDLKSWYKNGMNFKKN